MGLKAVPLNAADTYIYNNFFVRKSACERIQKYLYFRKAIGSSKARNAGELDSIGKGDFDLVGD